MAESQSECKIINDFKMDVIRMVCHIYYSLEHCFLITITFAGHIHKDKPDAYICSRFLIDECKKGTGCPEHHLSKPYHWQYKWFTSDEWKSFGDVDNFALEKLYCDVSVEAPVDFKPAQSLEVSSIQRRVNKMAHSTVYFLSMESVVKMLAPTIIHRGKGR